jgi:hypothetical protein
VAAVQAYEPPKDELDLSALGSAESRQSELAKLGLGSEGQMLELALSVNPYTGGEKLVASVVEKFLKGPAGQALQRELTQAVEAALAGARTEGTAAARSMTEIMSDFARTQGTPIKQEAQRLFGKSGAALTELQALGTKTIQGLLQRKAVAGSSPGEHWAALMTELSDDISRGFAASLQITKEVGRGSSGYQKRLAEQTQALWEANKAAFLNEKALEPFLGSTVKQYFYQIQGELTERAGKQLQDEIGPKVRQLVGFIGDHPQLNQTLMKVSGGVESVANALKKTLMTIAVSGIGWQILQTVSAPFSSGPNELLNLGLNRYASPFFEKIRYVFSPAFLYDAQAMPAELSQKIQTDLSAWLREPGVMKTIVDLTAGLPAGAAKEIVGNAEALGKGPSAPEVNASKTAPVPATAPDRSHMSGYVPGRDVYQQHFIAMQQSTQMGITGAQQWGRETLVVYKERVARAEFTLAAAEERNRPKEVRLRHFSEVAGNPHAAALVDEYTQRFGEWIVWSGRALDRQALGRAADAARNPLEAKAVLDGLRTQLREAGFTSESLEPFDQLLHEVWAGRTEEAGFASNWAKIDAWFAELGNDQHDDELKAEYYSERRALGFQRAIKRHLPVMKLIYGGVTKEEDALLRTLDSIALEP